MNRTTTCALTILLSVYCAANCLAQQSPSAGKPAAPDEPKKEAAKPGIDKIAQCREALRKAEAEHPGNTVEVAEALDDLVASQIDASVVDTETLAEVNREVQVAKAAAGPQPDLSQLARGRG